MSAVNLAGCNALITGASAGIGREFARQLASRARSLVLVARRQERLEALHNEFQQRYPNLDVRIHKTDLAEMEQIKMLCQRLEQEKTTIDLLINNAGLGDFGPFASSDPERVEKILSVNISALTMLTRLILPSMIAQRRGAILNVSSSAGFLPIAGNAVYAATKAYVTSFSEAIRAELRDSGITVTTLCPGPVHTEFAEVARRPPRPPLSGPEISYVSVEEVVRSALASVEVDRAVVIPGRAMKIGMALVRLTPMPILRLALQASAKRI